MKFLVVVDMQKDFIDGALGTPEAVKIVPYVKARIAAFDGKVLFTRDTHFSNYMDTQEGKNLPVAHCIKDTPGWELHPDLEALRTTDPIDKIAFGSSALPEILGLCTDICVISNVMITKSFFPEVPIIVDAKGCAGVTPESHKNALAAMKMCQVQIINE